MIILPTRRRLERRRDSLYERLLAILPAASIGQVEDIMRKIHIINLKLKTYFNKAQYEATETNEEDHFKTDNYTW